VLDRVSVTYPDRTTPALSPVSLRLNPGETVALTGPSGAGKSTLAGVLAGLIAPSTGAVALDDGASTVDLADVDPRLWRQMVGYVPQHPYLFAGTVAANIDLAGTQPPDAVARAASAAQLDDLPAGLSTVVGESGAGLSAGQRRRVALARAFLHGGQVLILDEPTANLDPATEAELVCAIRRLSTGDRTVVIVAHRPALVAAADREVRIGAADAAPVDLAGPAAAARSQRDLVTSGRPRPVPGSEVGSCAGSAA
jgi:ABC-type multidrug transport system fused ATPase/permease subunit